MLVGGARVQEFASQPKTSSKCWVYAKIVRPNQMSVYPLSAHLTSAASSPPTSLQVSTVPSERQRLCVQLGWLQLLQYPEGSLLRAPAAEEVMHRQPGNVRLTLMLEAFKMMFLLHRDNSFSYSQMVSDSSAKWGSTCRQRIHCGKKTTRRQHGVTNWQRTEHADNEGRWEHMRTEDCYPVSVRPAFWMLFVKLQAEMWELFYVSQWSNQMLFTRHQIAPVISRHFTRQI